MELSKQEKLKLIEFFEFLLDKETSKSLDEMNTEAIDAYVKILLNLQDKHIKLSSDFINEQVRKIFHTEEITAAPETAKTTKKHYNKKKIWLVAACISILLALFSIASFSSERSVIDVLEDFIGTFEFIPFGKEIDIGKDSYGKSNSVKVYKSINEFVKKEKVDLICPSDTIAVIKHISIGEIDGKEEINIAFENSDLFIRITRNTVIPKETINICNKKISLNGNEYYLCIMEDSNHAQAYFMCDNNMYYVKHSDEKSLIEILNNLEEIKNEN